MKRPNIPGATPNGGVMVKFPDPRYVGTTAEVLAEKPTGYNYDLCPSAAPAFCGLPAPAPSTTYSWAGGDGPYPPPYVYEGAYCARNGPNNVTNLAGTGPAVNGSNANNHEHWLSVYCGHEIQVNESLQIPGIDGIKTGSVYGFANLNAEQARTYERQTQGVWHEMEIRLVGQQFTVLVDGHMINQFDNSVPHIASRNGDPPTPARQFPRGYMGLQTHGGTDRIFYREIQVKDLGAGDIPRNVEAPEVGGSGRVGKDLTCGRGEWVNAPGADFGVSWYRANPVGSDHPHYHAPSQEDLGNLVAPADPRYGPLPRPFVGPLKGRRGQEVHADGGRHWQARLLPGVGEQRRRHDLADRVGAADRRRRLSASAAGPETTRGRRCCRLTTAAHGVATAKATCSRLAGRGAAETTLAAAHRGLSGGPAAARRARC